MNSLWINLINCSYHRWRNLSQSRNQNLIQVVKIQLGRGYVFSLGGGGVLHLLLCPCLFIAAPEFVSFQPESSLRPVYSNFWLLNQLNTVKLIESLLRTNNLCPLEFGATLVCMCWLVLLLSSFLLTWHGLFIDESDETFCGPSWHH